MPIRNKYERLLGNSPPRGFRFVVKLVAYSHIKKFCGKVSFQKLLLFGMAGTHTVLLLIKMLSLIFFLNEND